MKLNRSLFTDNDRAAMPAVMTGEEFFRFCEERINPRVASQTIALYEGMRGMANAFPLPPPHVLCSCGEEWSISECHDIDQEGCFECLDLTSYAGMTLKEVGHALLQRTDAVRVITPPLTVKTSALRDTEALADDDPLIASELSEADRVDWDHIVVAGQHTIVFCYTYYHGACFRALERERERVGIVGLIEGMRRMLESAGFEDVTIIASPVSVGLWAWIESSGAFGDASGFDASSLPYYRVDTRQGVFGLFFATSAALDLYGTGILLTDVEPDLNFGVSSDLPPVMGLNGDLEQLRHLRTLMEERHISNANAL